MRIPFRLDIRAWIVFPLLAIGFLAWVNTERAQRVVDVSNVDHLDAAIDANSPTGYPGGKRWLIVPEHNNASYQWITETQQMLARGEGRVRHVNYENAPIGRDVHAASPYRWWLGLLAKCDQMNSGLPLALSVERAALIADPLLHLLLLLGTTLFVARYFGVFAAALMSLCMATLFPLAGAFLPGVPDSYGLSQACALWSVLPLLTGAMRLQECAGSNPASHPLTDLSRRFLFFVAGVAGAFGLWISASDQVPILAGVAIGGIAAVLSTRSSAKTGQYVSAPWRIWSLGGATTCLFVYLVEYYPAHMEMRLEVNHPLYGLAWLGVGELFFQVETLFQRGKGFWNLRRALGLLLAVTAVAALPITMKLQGIGVFHVADPLASRLSNLSNSTVANSLMDWIVRDGLTTAFAATCLPLLLLIPSFWLLARRQTSVGLRTAFAIALGPVLVTLLLACYHIHSWIQFDVAMLALIVITTVTLHQSAYSIRSRWLWAGLVGSVLITGLTQLLPPMGANSKNEFTPLEIEGLMERGLAHWLADHIDPAGSIVLLPPARSSSFNFYGGLRVLGTPNWENRDGLSLTARIVSATTADEAQALMNQRGITHLVIPSWDSDLDAFAGWVLGNPDDSFISALHRWALPPWLRALPYRLPSIAGLEGQSVVILQITDENDRAASLGRLAEYFVEMQQPDLAASAGQSLRLFPSDLGALVALAQVERAAENAPGFAKVFEVLQANIASGSDRALPWDRRVSLAAVLVQGKREDLAREQVRRCLEKINETSIRSLTTMSLYRLLVLSKAFGLRMPNPKLQDYALKMLPVELRDRIAGASPK